MSENGKTWLRLRWRTMFWLVLIALIGWSTYSYWWEYNDFATRRARELLAPAAGAQCTVLYLAEPLGMEKNSLSPQQIAGVSNHVQGTFVQLNDDWIVLETNDEEQLWIPREHVLLLRVK